MSKHKEFLAAMGIDVWVSRDSITSPLAADEATDLPDLARTVAACARCELQTHRTQTVFGAGNPSAQWMVIGEAPGAEEDRSGEPFVGRAGQLLSAMFLAIGLPREQLYIANILKCRPPESRDPKAIEIAQCRSYLARQVALVEPRIIVAVGRVAAQNLLEKTTPIGKMRGQRYTYGDQEIPVVVTYHPADLLRSPQEKRKSWQDLNFAKKVFEENT